MHRAAPGLGGEAVSELVGGLHDGVRECQQQQIVWLDNAGEVRARQLPPVDRREQHRPCHREQPDAEAGGCEDPAGERGRALEQRVRVEEWQADGERIQQARPATRVRELLEAAEELQSVGANVAAQDVRGVQRGEQADRLALARRRVTQVGHGRVPDLAHAPPAVHRRDEVMSGWAEAVAAARGGVLEHVPALTAVAVPVDLRVLAKRGLQVLDPVPLRAVERFRHRLVRAATTRRRAAASRRVGGSRSRSGCGDRCRSCRRPPCPAAASRTAP